MKLMCDSLILSHLQFGITCWGFESNRLFKLQKRTLRIMTNSKYDAHTEPFFKDLKVLQLDGIFYIQWMKLLYKFTNNTLPKYCHSLFRYNRKIYEIETRTNSQLHIFPTRTHSAENALRHHIPKLICVMFGPIVCVWIMINYDEIDWGCFFFLLLCLNCANLHEPCCNWLQINTMHINR